MTLYISASVDRRGDAVVLNSKDVAKWIHFLAKFKVVKRFVTRVDGKSGSMEVGLLLNTKMGLFLNTSKSQGYFREAVWLIGGVELDN